MDVTSWTILIATILNGIAALHNLGTNKRLKEQQILSGEMDSNEVFAGTVRDILQSSKEIINGYKALAVDIEKENRLRDKKIKVLQESLAEAKTSITALRVENENLKRVSAATIAGIEVLVSQLKREGIEPIWEVSPRIVEILETVVAPKGE